MYTAYWQLLEEPFQNLNDPRYAFLSEQHSEGLARLLYLVHGRKLGGVLSGPYGVGKSMILDLLGRQIREKEQSRFIRIDAPPGGTAAFVRQMLWALGYDRPSADVAEALQLLGVPCAPSSDAPVHTVLAVDEAQMIRDHSTFEFLHLITNLRTTPAEGIDPRRGPTFTLLLCGHTDLLDALRREEALCQRLQLVWRLLPLDERQTGEYLRHRLAVAGARRELFSPDTIPLIYRASQGLPRLINNLADLALMIGAAMQAPQVTREIVEAAIAEMESAQPPPSAAAN